MVAENAEQMIHGKQNSNYMETNQDYRHIKIWKGSCDPKKQPTNISLVSDIQAVRVDDTKQNSTYHRATSHQGAGRFQTRKIVHKPTSESYSTYE